MAIQPHVLSSLQKLNFRKLTRGELVILANVIARHLPLAPMGTDNFSMYVISCKPKINTALSLLLRFTHLDDESSEFLFSTVKGFCQWRYNVAYNKGSIFFSGDPNMVIDDVTGILRVMDCDTLGELSGIALSANGTMSMFTDIVNNAFSNENEEEGTDTGVTL